MSATSFLRQRRAVAVKYIGTLLLDGRHKARVEEVLLEYDLTPADLGTLAGNNDVLSIADALAANKLDQAELDDLETLNTITVGDRAAVHSPDVRDDQFEDKLQHPAAETVGVGNMHDGPQAAEDLGNVAKVLVDEHDGSVAAAIVEKAEGLSSGEPVAGEHGALASHNGLPDAAPTSAPAVTNQITAEDERPTDPDKANPGAETVVDLERAAKDQAKVEKAEDKAERAGEAAINAMSRDELVQYAERQRISLDGTTSRTTVGTIAKRILAAQKGAE